MFSLQKSRSKYTETIFIFLLAFDVFIAVIYIEHILTAENVKIINHRSVQSSPLRSRARTRFLKPHLGDRSSRRAQKRGLDRRVRAVCAADKKNGVVNRGRPRNTR